MVLTKEVNSAIYLQIWMYGSGNNASLRTNCDYEIGNVTDNQDLDCRPTCRNELVKIKNALGCCVNYFNRSTSYQSNPPQGSPQDSLSGG